MKPSLALHIGMPKTGTTALQARLAASRKLLIAKGILYPETNIAKAHHFLALPLDFQNYGPRLMVSRYGPNNAQANTLFDQFWGQLMNSIVITKPNSVILSTEYLFSRVGLDGSQKLFRLIKEAFSDITVVGYVRQPSKHFASALQQQVKYSSKLPKLLPTQYRKYIELWEEQFPAHVVIRKYERAALKSNDIVEDFLFYGLGLSNTQLEPTIQANETMSAEAAALMQDYQSVHQSSFDDVPTREKYQFRKKLLRLDKAVLPREQPLLHSNLIQYLDSSSSDLLWLRDQYKIVFDGVDYGQIGRFEKPPGEFRMVSDFVKIDYNRLEKLRWLMGANWWQRLKVEWHQKFAI